MNRQAITLLSGLAMAGACSGGSGDSPDSPPPENTAPAFTSPSSITIDENTTGEVYSFETSDADGDTVALELVAGGDEDAFDIVTATGAVALSSPLDFEAPADADAGNDYEITVRASDGAGGVSAFTVTISVADLAEDGRLERVGSGYTQPLYAEAIPGTTLLAIVEKGGLARVLDPETGTTDAVAMLDVSAEISTNGERGLLGLAFSPAFATDRTFYVNLTNPAGDTEIRRYEMFSGSSTQADPATADIIFTTSQPATNHNAGWIGFSNDGLLYIPLGDGGGAGDPNGNAQDLNEVLGKILRVDVAGDDYPADDLRDYAIPAGNPFASGGGRPEIFAIGVRNPFRASVDPVTGDLFIGDVGQGAIEEIDRLPADGGGTNFGWNLQEGTQSYAGGADSADFTDPVAEYGRGSGPFQGQSVTGGYVYRGPVAAIQDHYVFGDFISGNYWSIPVEDLQSGSTVASSQFQRLNDLFPPDTGSLGNISSFGLDADGNLLVIGYGGSVYRLVAAQ